MRIRSTAIAVASSGRPKTSRFIAWAARPSGVSSVSETLVKRRNQRVGPRRTRIVLTVARRALPASALRACPAPGGPR